MAYTMVLEYPKYSGLYTNFLQRTYLWQFEFECYQRIRDYDGAYRDTCQAMRLGVARPEYRDSVFFGSLSLCSGLRALRVPDRHLRSMQPTTSGLQARPYLILYWFRLLSLFRTASTPVSAFHCSVRATCPELVTCIFPLLCPDPLIGCLAPSRRLAMSSYSKPDCSRVYGLNHG